MRAITAITLVALLGCDVQPAVQPAKDPVAAAADWAKIVKQAQARIDAAGQDPDVSKEELEIIEVLETARQSLLLTERILGRDLSEEIHPTGSDLQQLSLTMLIDAVESTQAENETHRALCLKKADECEADFPEHAADLREVAARLAKQKHITKLQLFKLRKQAG